MQEKIAIFFTGGTIAMRGDEGGVRPGVRPAELLAELFADAPPLVEILPVEWADLPSPHMTPELMFRLAGDVKAMLERDDVRGAVITHGTDVMEETAFMLDLLVPTEKSVVFTGSMRSHGEPGFDGLRNLASAVRVCLLPLPPGSGVVVVMADKIFAAREVAKIHSMGVDSFGSPGAGPLGTCVAGGVQLFRLPLHHLPLPACRIEPKVDLVALAPGMDGTLLACARAAGAKGLVVEAFGAGNVPLGALAEIEQAVAAGLPVVLTSRCIEGGVWPVYGYSGGALRLRDMGVVLGGSLSSRKARILLMVALGLRSEAGRPEVLPSVREVFEGFPK